MTLSDWLRLIGVALIGAGLLCFPVGFGVNPERDLSAFFNLADLGWFVKAGTGLLVSGGILLLASATMSAGRSS
jgi:hypothetical protein